VADLVIRDEDLQLLQGVLSLVAKELEPLQRVMTNLDHSAAGVLALIEALEEFAAARSGEVRRLGTGIAELAIGADIVRARMTAADARLGGEAKDQP
jgi:hypothetical protein